MQVIPLSISVIIPAYNAAASIEKVLRSCYAQTLPPAEIILVDDCSTDDTVAVVQRLFPEVRIIRQLENGGPAVARNAGWDAAGGDIIAFMDSDDTWHPQKLEIVAETFKRNPDVTFIAHPYVLQLPQVHYDHLPALQKESWLHLLFWSPVQTSCVCVRKTLAARFDNSYRYCEDHELSVRLGYKLGCYFIDAPLTALGRPQLTKGGASGNLWKMRKGQLRVYGSIARYNFAYIFLIPFLWLYSLTKFLFQWTRLRLSGQ